MVVLRPCFFWVVIQASQEGLTISQLDRTTIEFSDFFYDNGITIQGLGGSSTDRGTTQTNQSGGREVTQAERDYAHCYAFPGGPQVEAYVAVITCIVILCHQPGTVLFDIGSTFFYVSAYFALDIDMICDSLSIPMCVFGEEEGWVYAHVH